LIRKLFETKYWLGRTGHDRLISWYYVIFSFCKCM